MGKKGLYITFENPNRADVFARMLRKILTDKLAAKVRR